MSLDTVLDHADRNADAALDRLFELLRIPSISTDPAYDTETAKAAHWLAGELSGLGFDASVRDTTGHPMVVAHMDGEGPHVLFYGHYDVQPVDPLELWNSDPFDPKIEEQNGSKVIRARGSADDKGQLMTFVEAVRAFRDAGEPLPCRVSILFEGEEESGSPSLHPFLEANADELRADLALVCDTGMWDRETPAITVSLRGLAGEEVTVHASDIDLHSGYYGGAAANPIRVLADILSGLHDETGRVTLDGFYDGVAEVPDDVAAQWRTLGQTTEKFLGPIGLSELSGEDGRSVLEVTWSRPTAEVNGIQGGYTGEGFKTVIPAQASAKVSFRLVGDQDPDAVIRAFHAHVERHLPSDCTASYIPHGRSPATQLDWEMPALKKAAAALTDEWGKEAAVIGGGGSIPIVGDFRRMLGMDSLLVGFGLTDDAIHSPNEKYELASFKHGTRSWVRILHALAKG